MKRVIAITVLLSAASAYGVPTVADLPLGPGSSPAPLMYMGQLTTSLAREVTAANATQVFLENETVTLAGDLAVVGGSVAAGTSVSSYMIHLDSIGATSTLYEGHGTITFDRPVLGVIYATNDTATYARLTDSDTSVGLGPAFYDSDPLYRKLEIPQQTWQDVVSVAGNVVTINLWTTSAMDDVRVITAAPAVVPAPGALTLLAIGSSLAGWLRRRGTL